MTDYNYDAFSPVNYNPQSADGPEIGDKAPNFDLETHDGQKHRLLDFFKGLPRSIWNVLIKNNIRTHFRSNN